MIKKGKWYQLSFNVKCDKDISEGEFYNAFISAMQISTKRNDLNCEISTVNLTLEPYNQDNS